MKHFTLGRARMVTSDEHRVEHVHRAPALDPAELIATSPF
jgi:hypothetical protein